jgi:hypothetical protein
MYIHSVWLLKGMWLYEDLCVLFPLAIFQARTGSYPKLTADVPTSSLFYAPVVTSVSVAILI